jgi:hypothetical protein
VPLCGGMAGLPFQKKLALLDNLNVYFFENIEFFANLGLQLA